MPGAIIADPFERATDFPVPWGSPGISSPYLYPDYPLLTISQPQPSGWVKVTHQGAAKYLEPFATQKGR